MAPLIPEHLAKLWRSLPGGAAALERLPELIEDCVEMWGLTLGRPYPKPALGGGAGFVASAIRPDGSPVVLKINFPDVESEHEAAALRIVGGRGAVRVLEDDPDRRALLLERLDPGTTLWKVPEEHAVDLAADVLSRFWHAVPDGHPFDLLAERAAFWIEDIRASFAALGTPFEADLADEAVRLATELAQSVDESYLLHQDFHGGNVLAAQREPWLAIDPKPLVGERAFDTASLLRDRRPELLRSAAPRRVIRRRLDRLAEALELDRERMRAWGIVHAVAWGIWRDGFSEEHIACARLLREL